MESTQESSAAEFQKKARRTKKELSSTLKMARNCKEKKMKRFKTNSKGEVEEKMHTPKRTASAANTQKTNPNPEKKETVSRREIAASGKRQKACEREELCR